MVGVTQTEDAGSHSSSSKENDKKDEDTARYIYILSIPLSCSVIQLIIYSIIELIIEHLIHQILNTCIIGKTSFIALKRLLR